MTDQPSSPQATGAPAGPSDPWADGAEAEEFKPLSREEAQQWRARQPSTSVWRVVRWQVVLVALAAVLGWALSGRPAVGWSVFYGGLCIAVPTALMAWGLTSSALSRAVTRAFPGAARVSLAGVLFWEGVKVLLALAMMVLAPRWVVDLSWLGLVAGLVVALKAYWLTFWFGTRRPL